MMLCGSFIVPLCRRGACRSEVKCFSHDHMVHEKSWDSNLGRPTFNSCFSQLHRTGRRRSTHGEEASWKRGSHCSHPVLPLVPGALIVSGCSRHVLWWWQEATPCLGRHMGLPVEPLFCLGRVSSRAAMRSYPWQKPRTTAPTQHTHPWVAFGLAVLATS